MKYFLRKYLSLTKLNISEIQTSRGLQGHLYKKVNIVLHTEFKSLEFPKFESSFVLKDFVNTFSNKDQFLEGVCGNLET